LTIGVKSLPNECDAGKVNVGGFEILTSKSRLRTTKVRGSRERSIFEACIRRGEIEKKQKDYEKGERREVPKKIDVRRKVQPEGGSIGMRGSNSKQRREIQHGKIISGKKRKKKKKRRGEPHQ